jgi:hypothetical protein
MRQWLQLLTTLAVLEPVIPRAVPAPPIAAARSEHMTRAVVLSDQARRFLALQYRNYSTEFMGCMIGEVRDSVAYITRIAPADVEPFHSTTTWVVPAQSCEDAGWTGTIGRVHSHPGGAQCSYFVPGTEVLNSDGQSFIRSDYSVDAIMCGDHLVWIARELTQRQLTMIDTGTGGAVGGAP